MTACAIRYRLDGPGPAAFLVECEGELRLYTRGSLGGEMPRSRLLAVLAERGCRWLPASGEVNLDADERARTGWSAGDARRPDSFGSWSRPDDGAALH